MGILSVWESVAAAEAFVYRGPHSAAMKRRHEWFVPGPLPPSVCWWMPSGHHPSLSEAEQRLEHLHRGGKPGATAFPLGHQPEPAGQVIDLPDRGWRQRRDVTRMREGGPVAAASSIRTA
ncbi:DUF3291 domain-containing protein [Streptomyces sp. PmtG]